MGDYEGAEKVLIDNWVKQRLASKAAEFNAIAPNLSTKIFENKAPLDTSYPFIIIQCQSPPRDIRGVGISRVMVDSTYIVKAVMQGENDDALVPIAKVIDQALTTNITVVIGNSYVFAAVRETQFSMEEEDNGVTYRHLGGQYFIQAQG